MASQDKRTATILTYTTDVHALVTHGLQAIEQQVEQLKKVSHKEAEPAVVAFQHSLEGQKAALEARITALGGKASSPVKDAVSGALGALAGLINKTRDSATAKSIRDDYTFLSHLAVSWLMLHTTTTSLGDEETAAVAQRGYRETARMVMHIDKILPTIVIEELGEDKELQPRDVAEGCARMIKDSWTRDAATGAAAA